MFDYNMQFNAAMYSQQMMNSNFSNMQNQFVPGYKSENMNFADVMGQTSGGMSGARTANRGIVFTQGGIAKTNNDNDLAINGQGLFVVSDGSKTHYSRDGRFFWKNDQLCQQATGMPLQGFPLDAQGNLNGKMTTIQLGLDPQTKLYGGRFHKYRFDTTGKLYGETTVSDPTTNQQVTTSTPIYQVALSSFANPSGLQRSSATTFVESENSGQAVVGVAGQGALGQVVPQSQELSNVDFAAQAAALGMARMSYEANTSAFKAMDRLTQTAIGLIR